MTANLASAVPLRIGIVAGEASGDILGAGLIQAIKQRHPDAIFEGIAGPKMLAEGCHSFFPQDRLAVMGLVEPLKRLPELLKIRKYLKQHFIQQPPDIFIGIDSPDFNIDLELALKKADIKTLHYVSPSLWAWRQGRIKKMAKAVDGVLALFPFEQDFYHRHNVPAICVGHTLADQIPISPQTDKARAELNITASDSRYIALLPGSRSSEVERMLPVFLDAARLLAKEKNAPKMQFLIPAANEVRWEQIQALVDSLDLAQSDSGLIIQTYLKQSHSVMEASDVVVMASGTTTLEAMLLKKPMVIAYKVAALSYFIFSRMVKVKFIGLPNLLANKPLAKELIQRDATPEAVAQEVKRLLLCVHDSDSALLREYHRLHLSLKKNANQKAADAVLNIIAGEPLDAESSSKSN